MIKFIVRLFFNTFYRIKPPPMVEYWKKGDAARARVTKATDGSLQMEIEGEKEPYPGFPRGHVLIGPLASIKHKVKNAVFNQVFEEISKMSDEYSPDAVPLESMSPAVRHIWETFEKLEDCEVVDDMKGRIKLIKKVICWFIQEDDAYRFRTQLFLDLIDQKKIKLSEADKYYARGKYWKVDRYKKLFGKVYDAYEY